MKLTIAIDGPAGAGKSTIAKILAKNFNIMYINTGSMYRAITLKALENNIPPDEIEELCRLTDSLDMYFQNDRLILNGEDINDKLSLPEISSKVSHYASISEIRTRLVKLQREMASKFDVVMDGRDIGTVVLKDAAFKFFLTASPEERAQRRFDELNHKGLDVNYEDILKEIIRRDFLDSNREVDPLRKAEDAIEIDTTGLNINEVVNKMSIYINKTLENIFMGDINE